MSMGLLVMEVVEAIRERRVAGWVAPGLIVAGLGCGLAGWGIPDVRDWTTYPGALMLVTGVWGALARQAPRPTPTPDPHPQASQGITPPPPPPDPPRV